MSLPIFFPRALPSETNAPVAASCRRPFASRTNDLPYSSPVVLPALSPSSVKSLRVAASASSAALRVPAIISGASLAVSAPTSIEASPSGVVMTHIVRGVDRQGVRLHRGHQGQEGLPLL